MGSVKLNFDAPVGQVNGTVYRADYRLAGNTNWITALASVEPNPNSSNIFGSVQGAPQNIDSPSIYEFRVVATFNGLDTPGNIVSIPAPVIPATNVTWASGNGGGFDYFSYAPLDWTKSAMVFQYVQGSLSPDGYEIHPCVTTPPYTVAPKGAFGAGTSGTANDHGSLAPPNKTLTATFLFTDLSYPGNSDYLLYLPDTPGPITNSTVGLRLTKTLDYGPDGHTIIDYRAVVIFTSDANGVVSMSQ